MITDRTRPDPPDKARQEVALARLNPLTGRWDLELSVPTNPPTIVRGLWSTLDWMEGGLFLIWRWGPARPDLPGGLFPSSLSIIGYDDATRNYFMHYFDSRRLPDSRDDRDQRRPEDVENVAGFFTAHHADAER
jgi:hypothetical protein